MEACNIILDAWANDNPSEDMMPIRTSVFTFNGIRPETAAFVASADPKGCYEKYMLSLVYFPSGPSISRACDILSIIYGEQSKNVYSSILDEIEESRNDDGECNDSIREYVEELFKLVSEYAPIPKWIISPGDSLPSHKALYDNLPKPSVEVVVDIPSNEEIINIVTDAVKGVPGYLIDNQDSLRNQLMDRYSQMDDTEKKNELEKFARLSEEYSMVGDLDIYRVLGPSHVRTGFNDLDTRSNHPCAKFGGCRMMSCIEFSNVNEDGEVIDEMIEITNDYASLDWFTGNCDYCKRKIRYKHHAVRMPMSSGGWDGCYCSWKHIKADIADPSSPIHELVKLFEIEMIEKGIYDRTWPEPEEEPLPETSYEDFLIQAAAYKSEIYADEPYKDLKFRPPEIVLPIPMSTITGDEYDITVPPKERESNSSSRVNTDMSLIREELGIE